ncbi:protein PHLOEM UNLOADING MODULATOR [Magnolia sinica]|uniref:protein PHLOEM UNLOADING MODULATOR n=1 Tax=Magnolia sinica TaxID=86752 RepID=UPI002657D37D|nr:protein PHLOEM UNLOADING MODULATOR [Magnolia sinica]
MGRRTQQQLQRYSFPRNAGLGLAAISYVAIDYLRHVSPPWHERLQPMLWATLALASVARAPFYRQWSLELHSAIPFIASMLFMLAALLFEALSVRSVTAVLGRDWHQSTPPLPDTGQWLFLALNEKLPHVVVEILRARIIGLHHYLMLFLMLAFSVLFNSVKAPGLGLGARYMFTMAIGRLLRAVSFISTILPSTRPWCASSRFRVPPHPHPWAQKYYVPYASDFDAIHKIIQSDRHYVNVGEFPGEYRPDWGSMSFLIDFLRPTVSEGSSWYNLLKKAGGGCNDLLYSGHMLVAVLTAMAWTEAYGGWTSALIWLLVLHSGQREIRERHHYSVDCVVAIYVGILLWKMTGFIWSAKDESQKERLVHLEKIQDQLIKAAKDSDMDQVRELLKEVELAGQERQSSTKWAIWGFACITILFSLTIGLLAFTWTSDG